MESDTSIECESDRSSFLCAIIALSSKISQETAKSDVFKFERDVFMSML